MKKLNTKPTLNPLSLDTKATKWVDKTLTSLSVEERIAQLFVLSSRYDTDAECDDLLAIAPGGIHRFPCHNLEQHLRATRRLLDESEGVPPIITGDIEGGSISYPFATHIPNQLGVAACDDLELTEELAKLVALESRALGYDWTFTPVVDLNVAFRNAVVGTRSYGSDVEKVREQARVYVRVLQEHGMAATAKHWPGEGYDERDQHLVTTANPQNFDDWMDTFGSIYSSLINDGVMTIMSAHIALPSFIRSLIPDAGRSAFQPASVSDLLNRVLLRERLGFQGLIVSDATVMGGVTSWLGRQEAVPAFIENGCDAFLFSRDPAGDMKLMLDGVRTGKLSEGRLEEAVRRMLTLKAKLQLHTKTSLERLPVLEETKGMLRSDQHMKIAQKACGKGITLVKDTAKLLPLKSIKQKRVVVVEDKGWSFFSGAPERNYDPFKAELTARGCEVRGFDKDNFPTAEDADLLVYLIGQEATPSVSNIHLDFAKLHGSPRNGMAQFNQEIPTIIVSFGQPYYLFDAPNYQTYINAYCSIAEVQRQLVPRLFGEVAFEGVSPVDAFCGLEHLKY
ncbi:glycoside hydrolase family 3 protein [Hirschia baltica]|uniref:beta-N-acetylhexosaminidase n=1 Tax=Hirschia baltica (strain ATCC 49814 / DSM 5838 / IFAM 1418) TaxID=582402 RepID=C6XPQ2_HIRBI|nr:glycoside hydrolase family 3 N-terminal domain-containing protein [Hirschia baltica]ACT60317.1 glycoside hydrolase family 3 domain protein [Hirschia baltica ATCC 49814]